MIIVFSSVVTVKVIDAPLQPWTKHNATCVLYGIPILRVLLCWYSIRMCFVIHWFFSFFFTIRVIHTYIFHRWTWFIDLSNDSFSSLNIFIIVQFLDSSRELNNPTIRFIGFDLRASFRDGNILAASCNIRCIITSQVSTC